MTPDNVMVQLGIPVAIAGDVAVVIAVIMFSLVFGYFMSQARLSGMLIMIYIARVVTGAIPGELLEAIPYAHMLVFLALLTLLTLFSGKLFSVFIPGSTSYLNKFLLSFLEAGLLLSTVISLVMPREALEYIPKTTYYFLVSPYAQLAWLAVPLVFAFIVNRKYT